MSTWKKQNETSPTEKPVLLVKDVISYQGRVDRELLYLINKAKYYVPKPKPKVNETGWFVKLYTHLNIYLLIPEAAF